MKPIAATRARKVAARRRGERGFALFEILVAFLILALGLAAVLVGVSVAMRSDVKTQTSRSTLRVAQSRLEAAGVAGALLPGHSEGRIGDRYRWRQTVTAIRSDLAPPKPPAGQTERPAADAVTAFWVEVAVHAADGSVSRLAGLKLAPAVRP